MIELDGMTKDLVKENIEKLKELFPTIVKEDKIDYGAGVKILVNDGDVVKTNQELAILYVKDQNIKLDDELLDIFEIDETN